MMSEPARAEPAYRFLLWLAPVIALLAAAAALNAGWSFAQAITAAVTVWCAIWWIAETVPMAVTALLPLALFPLLGVITPQQAAQSYGHPMILLLLGGFLLSRGMESSGAHRRLALGMIRLIGGERPRRVIVGFVFASGVLSMWISNTATTLMLLPVAAAALGSTASRKVATALFLGVAYGASVGGIGTPVGTPPNLIFMSVYSETTGASIGFLAWMSWGIWVSLLGLPLIGLWLTRSLPAHEPMVVPPPGPWRPAERRVLSIFAITALLWVTRSEPFGGWSALLNLPTANDASVAMLAVVALFVISNGRGGRLLDWETAVRIPWGVLILFGGGIALAEAFMSSALSELIGGQLVGLAALPPLLAMLLIGLSVSFLTEVTSNTATTNLLMPILAAAGLAAGIDPALLMVPAAMSASCAFMLPVATAPNAIVFGSGQVTIKEMVREGFALNLMLAVVVALVCWWRLA